MNASTIPVTCTVAIAAICAAGLSHWWSVNEMVAMVANGGIQPPAESPSMPANQAVPPEPIAPAAAQAPPPGDVASSQSLAAEQQKFYDALITRMEILQNQNRDLLGQLAETNRDLMKLEFRVDTHSASFRPLPVTEAQPFTSLDIDAGVLPPRAMPIDLTDQE
jgi:hypothetical protein